MHLKGPLAHLPAKIAMTPHLSVLLFQTQTALRISTMTDFDPL